jgi:NAD(P)H-dependent FMN reductase
MGAADALVLACPEYNYSIAPAMKNALDWASREPDNALLAGKAIAIMGAGAAWAPRAPNIICDRFACFLTCTR